MRRGHRSSVVGHRCTLFGVATIALLTGAASPASAQSLFGSRGLGVVVAPVDGRAAALGGLGIALPGPSAAMINPADAGEANRRGVTVAIQPSATELETTDGSGSVDATRFPLMQLLLPVGRRTVLSGGYGAFLDQNWGVIMRSIEPIGTDSVTAVDEVTSRGGIAQGRVGVAYTPTDDLTLGAAIGLLTGSATRTATRSFEDDDIGLAPFRDEVRTTYSAPLASLGARYRIGSMVRVGGSVTWIGDLSIDTEGDDETDVAMPLQVAGGATAQLLEDLLVVVSTRWTGWSAVEGLHDTTAEDVLEIGGGVEWSGLTTARRVFPVRLGGRWGGQPFSFGSDAPAERAFGAGIGARLAGSAEIPAALVDLAIERGSRGEVADNGLSETFWRATLSISLFSQ